MEDIWKIPDDIAKKSKEKNDWIDCYFKLETILKGENIREQKPKSRRQ